MGDAGAESASAPNGPEKHDRPLSTPDPSAPSSGAGARDTAARQATSTTRTANLPEDDEDDGWAILWFFVKMIILLLGAALCAFFLVEYGLPHSLRKLFGLSGPNELTTQEWEDKTYDKTVFVMFFAPWCNHCQKLKPDWKALTALYANNSDVLIASMDCVGKGKDLCNEIGIRDFPSLKYGAPFSLEDYKGQRGLEALTKFASSLSPVCAPGKHIDLCSDADKALIREYAAMTASDRETKIKKLQDDMSRAQTEFVEFTRKLRQSHQEVLVAKEAGMKQMKETSMFTLLVAVEQAAKAAQGSLSSDADAEI